MMDLLSLDNGAGTTFVVGREKRTDPAVAGRADGVCSGLVLKEHGGMWGQHLLIYGSCWYEDRLGQ
eukprot:10368097-Ditylum_brightwellii.AAC.1